MGGAKRNGFGRWVWRKALSPSSEMQETGPARNAPISRSVSPNAGEARRARTAVSLSIRGGGDWGWCEGGGVSDREKFIARAVGGSARGTARGAGGSVLESVRVKYRQHLRGAIY